MLCPFIYTIYSFLATLNNWLFQSWTLMFKMFRGACRLHGGAQDISPHQHLLDRQEPSQWCHRGFLQFFLYRVWSGLLFTWHEEQHPSPSEVLVSLILVLIDVLVILFQTETDENKMSSGSLKRYDAKVNESWLKQTNKQVWSNKKLP